MSKLKQVVEPVVCSNMTRTELIRAIEHAIPYPAPLMQLILEHLRGHVGEPLSSTPPGPHALHCPACGAQLQFD